MGGGEAVSGRAQVGVTLLDVQLSVGPLRVVTVAVTGQGSRSGNPGSVCVPIFGEEQAVLANEVRHQVLDGSGPLRERPQSQRQCY